MPWTQDSLATDRLLLRAFHESDRPTVITFLTDPDVRRYLGGPVDLGDDFASHPMGEQPNVWAIEVTESGQTVGTCSFKDDRGPLELSYSLVPAAWGKGYATEACTRALEWAWATTAADWIIAVTQSANAPSITLLGRLGFVEVDRFEEFDAEQSLFELARPAIS